ncbi:MAG: response regulator transcription factor [Epsilonproteobacteria bacterium]|nr:response regulator transcription factor [Campylobacterota bacterium]
MRITLLEDDSFIAQEIKIYFEMKNHQVEVFENGKELLDNPNINTVDIFILDINTPIKNGIETLKELRKLNIQTPAVFLTSMSDIDYIKLGFDAGCSDYIRKPFHFEELEIRINKVLFSENAKKIQIGPQHFFDLSRKELIDDEKIVELSENEKNLLFFLIKNINHVLNSNVIIDYIWQDKIISDNTLRTLIKKLRSKSSYDFIKNIRGSGYKIEKYDKH